MSWSTRYPRLLAAMTLMVLAAAQPVRAQSTVVKQMLVVLRIPGLNAVDAIPAGGTPVRQGDSFQADGAARLFVSSNSAWTLLADVPANTTVRVSTPAAVEPGRASADWTPAGPGLRPLTGGSRSNREALTVDYRWTGSAHVPQVVYTVVAS